MGYVWAFTCWWWRIGMTEVDGPTAYFQYLMSTSATNFRKRRNHTTKAKAPWSGHCDPFCERKHAAEIRDLKLNLLFQLNVKYLTIKSWTIEVLMWLHSSEDNLSKLQRILGMDKKIRARYPSVKCYRSFVATWWWAFMSPTLQKML